MSLRYMYNILPYMRVLNLSYFSPASMQISYTECMNG